MTDTTINTTSGSSTSTAFSISNGYSTICTAGSCSSCTSPVKVTLDLALTHQNADLALEKIMALISHIKNNSKFEIEAIDTRFN